MAQSRGKTSASSKGICVKLVANDSTSALIPRWQDCGHTQWLLLPLVYWWRTSLWDSSVETRQCFSQAGVGSPRLQATSGVAWRVGGGDKIKASQWQRRVELVKAEHPFTAISPACEVHANHNQAQNAALRRRASAYRSRQNLSAKRVEGLQRVLLDVQRLVQALGALALGNWEKSDSRNRNGSLRSPALNAWTPNLSRVFLPHPLEDHYPVMVNTH